MSVKDLLEQSSRLLDRAMEYRNTADMLAASGSEGAAGNALLAMADAAMATALLDRARWESGRLGRRLRMNAGDRGSRIAPRLSTAIDELVGAASDAVPALDPGHPARARIAAALSMMGEHSFTVEA